MNKNILYKTPRQFCEAVSNLEETKNLNLTRRPKFRFEPDNCAWWLVPGTDNPHFKHGKFYFAWDDKKNKKISAGIQLEKGLDEQIKSVYSSKKASRFIMEEDWYWNKFISLLTNNSFFNNLTKALGSVETLKITIDGGYVSEPTKFDPYQDKNFGKDQYTFDWNKQNPESLVISNSKRAAFILKLHHVKTISDLQSSLIELNKDAWLWLNIYITASFDIVAEGDESNIREIWNSYLSNFSFILSS